MKMKQKFAFEPRWYAVTIFFLVGVFLGGLILFIWIFNGGRLYGIQKIHPANSAYKFINPLLAVDVNQPLDFFDNNEAEAKISALIDQNHKSGLLTSAGVYFQDLENGHWFTINPDNKFLVGKTLKVPLMIAYFKAAEADPKILQKKLVYDLQDGESYAVEDMIRDMIIDDSNSSAQILFDNIDKQALNQVYSDLSIDFKEDLTSDDYINVKQNSLFYRILYNATYLNREDSEKALEIISQSDIGTGVASSLPQDITVAHRHPPIQQVVQKAGTLTQSNDCGIIYYPNHPYILCIMTNTKDKTGLESFLGKAGNLIYQDVSNKYKN